jgi:hypothetical protein
VLAPLKEKKGRQRMGLVQGKRTMKGWVYAEGENERKGWERWDSEVRVLGRTIKK